MSDVTLEIVRTEKYSVKTTEADIRAECDKQKISHEGKSLTLLLTYINDTYSGEVLLANLAGSAGTDADSEEWALDDWESDDDE